MTFIRELSDDLIKNLKNEELFKNFYCLIYKNMIYFLPLEIMKYIFIIKAADYLSMVLTVLLQI